MARLTNYNPLLITTYTATGTIAAGKPVGFDGAVCAADAHMLGVAIGDAAATATIDADKIASAVVVGEVDVIAGGAITAGDYVKVGTGGKFLSADATALAAGKVVGTAKTTASGDGVTVTVFIGLML